MHCYTHCFDLVLIDSVCENFNITAIDSYYLTVLIYGSPILEEEVLVT